MMTRILARTVLRPVRRGATHGLATESSECCAQRLSRAMQRCAGAVILVFLLSAKAVWHFLGVVDLLGQHIVGSQHNIMHVELRCSRNGLRSQRMDQATIGQRLT